MVDDKFFESDYIISNMDVFYTYKKLTNIYTSIYKLTNP